MPVAQSRLVDHIDVEGKLLRALDALGPVGGRDVLLVGGGPIRARQLSALGSRVSQADVAREIGAPDASADVIVGLFSTYRGVDGLELDEADRVLRPGGRLLVVHDYGRDDVSLLHDPAQPEYGSWSHRDGPFLRGGFKIRVIHCWWTFASVAEAAEVLGTAFGEAGLALAASMSRPRLSHNLAIYHRDRRAA